MSKNKQLDKDVSKAYSWCEKARALLKIKQSGPRFDKEGNDFKRFDEAMNQAKKLLEKLDKRKHPGYEMFAAEFVDFGLLAERIEEEKNLEKAKAIAVSLEFLNCRMEEALGTKTSTEVTEAQLKLIADESELYDKALLQADRILEKLQGYETIVETSLGGKVEQTTHSFLGDVPALIGAADTQHRLGDLLVAVSRLGMVPVEDEKQSKKYEQFLTFRRKYPAAQKFEQELRILDGMAQGNEPKRAAPVTQVLTAALDAAKGGDYETALAKLKTAEEANTKARKGLKSEDLKRVNEYAEERKKFEVKYYEVSSAVGRAARLPGAEEPEVKRLYEQCLRLLNDSRTTADRTTLIEDLNHARKQLDQVTFVLKEVTKASEKTVEEARQDDEAIKPWMKCLKQAQDGLRRIEGLTAAKKEYVQLMTLIGEAKLKIVTKGTITVGYAAAEKHLRDFEKIVETAVRMQEEALKENLPPNLQEAAVAAARSLYVYADLAPNFLSMIVNDELVRITDNVRSDLLRAKPNERGAIVDKALDDLAEMKKQLDDDCNSLSKEKQGLTTDLAAAKQKVETLESAGVPEGMLLTAQRTIDQTELHEQADREWAKGRERIALAVASLDEILRVHNQYKDAWKPRAEQLTAMRKLAFSLMEWPPLRTTIHFLLEDSEAVQSRFAQTFDYDGCIKQFDQSKLAERYEELKQQAALAPQNAKEQAERVRVADANVKEALSKLFLTLAALEGKMTGVVDPKHSELHKKHEELSTAWNGYVNTQYYQSKTPVGADVVESKAKEALSEIGKTLAATKQILSNDKLLTSFAKQTADRELKAYKSDLAGNVQKLLDQTRDLTHFDLSKEQRQLDVVLKTGLPEPQREQALLSLMNDLKQMIDSVRQRDAKRLEMGLQKQQELADDLKRLKSKNLTFKVYRELLEKDAEDIQAMLESDDPDMRSVAYKSMGELRKKIDQFDPDKEQPNVATFTQVEARIEEIGRLLGTESGTVSKNNVIKKTFPETFARLYGDYKKAVALAQRSVPEEGMKALDALEKPITEALKKGKEKSDKVAEYEERIRKAEEFWDKIKKETHTRATEKAGRVADYVADRLKEAEDILGEEDGLDQAEALLKKVETLLNDIHGAPDRREKLFAEDGRLKQEKETIIRMATQFKKEMSYFKEKTIVETRETLQARRKRGEMKQADLDDALKSLEGLENVASAISKTVKPYLAHLESLPHKKADAADAPELGKATTDFERARTMLQNAIKTAERLAGATMDVNVNISEDFKKVQKNWQDQAVAFRQALTTAKGEIPKVVEEVLKTVGQKDGLPQDQQVVQAFNDNAEKAQKLLDELSKHFRIEAFAGPFEVLAGDAKQQEERERLAAREQALQTMRQYRDDVLNDPVLTKLIDKKNPFAQPQVAAATAYVRAALKRVEIESLIGV